MHHFLLYETHGCGLNINKTGHIFSCGVTSWPRQIQPLQMLVTKKRNEVKWGQGSLKSQLWLYQTVPTEDIQNAKEDFLYI